VRCSGGALDLVACGHRFERKSFPALAGRSWRPDLAPPSCARRLAISFRLERLMHPPITTATASRPIVETDVPEQPGSIATSGVGSDAPRV